MRSIRHCPPDTFACMAWRTPSLPRWAARRDWDLYKAEVTIPIAFEIAAEQPEDLPAVVRRRVRDAMVEQHILERMVHDIKYLLSDGEALPEDGNEVRLWNNQREAVANGISYGKRAGEGK